MTEKTPVQVENVDTPRGLAFALTAYLMWGFLPLYMKLLSHVPPAEVVAHRVIWSVPLAGLVLILLRRTGDLRAALADPKMLAMAGLTAALVSVNWGIYVWAITSGNALDAALGYYINPLFSIFLGAVLLKERLSPAQLFAIVLAALGVVVIAVDAGQLPWAALGLTFSWGFYAFFKKALPIGPNQGFLLEVLILTPFALAYLGWQAANGEGHLFASAGDFWLLAGTGLVTAGPLMIYANGAKLVRLSTIGIMQYIAPTMIMLIAVLAFDEPFGTARAIAFPLIWAALVIYSLPLIKALRRQQAL